MVLYTGILMLGYATVYNILPVLAMYLNEDIDYEVATDYPELYKNLLKGRLLNTKTFFLWNSVALAGSALIIFPTLLVVHSNFY